MRPPGECRLGKGFALPLAPNPVRQPAGFPTPFRGWAYPVLFCAGVVCGRKPSAVRRMSGANLEVERLSLPNKPTETLEQLEKLVRCGDWGEFHSPLAPS